MTAAASKIVQWLMSGRGYCRLEDSYEPDCYRMASYAGPFDAANWMNLYGRQLLNLIVCRSVGLNPAKRL